MRIFIFIVLLIILAALSNQIYFFWKENHSHLNEYQSLQAELGKAQLDYNNLNFDLDYYLNPDNLEKELRHRFNYKLPGEKEIIIIPASSTSQ